MLNASLADRRDLGNGLCVIHIAPDAGVPSFTPGQFIRVGLAELAPAGADASADAADAGRLVKRAYSIASSPSEREALELYVVKVDEGRLTPEVWKLGQGGRLWVDNKAQGEFVLDPVGSDKHLVMLATGTGVAPYISMLRSFAGTGRWRRFTLVHGARYAGDLGYRDELEGLARRYPDVRYVPVVSREPLTSSFSGLRGRVLQVLEEAVFHELLGEPLDPASTHVFMCGNPDMVQGARALLEPRGFVLQTKKRPGTMHMERYW